MLDLALLLLPDRLLLVGGVGLALAFVFGLVARSRATRLLVSLIVVLVSAPYVEALCAALPWWLSIAILGFGAIYIVRRVLELVFGSEAAGHIIGNVVVSAGSVLLRVILGSMRFVWSLLARSAQ